jgi:hypothetical protein
MKRTVLTLMVCLSTLTANSVFAKGLCDIHLNLAYGDQNLQVLKDKGYNVFSRNEGTQDDTFLSLSEDRRPFKGCVVVMLLEPSVGKSQKTVIVEPGYYDPFSCQRGDTKAFLAVPTCTELTAATASSK